MDKNGSWFCVSMWWIGLLRNEKRWIKLFVEMLVNWIIIVSL